VCCTATGTVLDVPVEEGYSVIEVNNFNLGTTIATVADLGEMIFEGKIDASEVGKIKVNRPSIRTIVAIDETKFNAELEFIARKGISENGAIQFTIKAAVTLDSAHFICAGYSASADIVLARVDHALSLPEALIRFENEKPYVEMETGKQQFKKKSIKTGLSYGVNIEILAGLDSMVKIKRQLPSLEVVN